MKRRKRHHERNKKEIENNDTEFSRNCFVKRFYANVPTSSTDETFFNKLFVTVFYLIFFRQKSQVQRSRQNTTNHNKGFRLFLVDNQDFQCDHFIVIPGTIFKPPVFGLASMFSTVYTFNIIVFPLQIVQKGKSSHATRLTTSRPVSPMVLKKKKKKIN